jgi:5-methylcytosine-specific restriction endonuclease McrA
MGLDHIESAVEVLEAVVQELDADRMDPGLTHRLLGLFTRGERACAGAAAVLARRIGDPRVVARQQGTSMGRARAIVDLSERIADTPALEAAVRGGEVSLDQATEIAKAETAAPGCADALVEVAQREPFHELCRQARKAALENQREGLGTRQHAARRGSHRITDLGLVHVEADLEPYIGAPIVDRLEAEARRLAARAGKQEPFATYLADAFATLFGQPASGKGAKAEVVVVVSHEVAQRGWSNVDPGEVCHIPGIGPIDPKVARDIARDAFLTGVVCDGTDLRQMRRWTRHIPTEIRLALNLGSPPDFDGPKCVDCANRLRIEHDHHHPYADGGPTSLANLPDRCHPCHVAKTKADQARRPKRRRQTSTGRASPDRAPPGTG